MASGDKNDGGATLSIFLQLKKRMAMLGGETENLLLNSLDGKIPEWRETHAAAVKLTERFQTLNQRISKFLDQFLIFSSEIHEIDDSEIKTLISEMEKDRIEVFQKGIQQRLKEVDDIDCQLIREYSRVSENYGEVLDFEEGVTVDEINDFAFEIDCDQEISLADINRVINFGENAFESDKFEKLLQVPLPSLERNLKQSKMRKESESSGTDKDLSRVLVEMYGFSASEADYMEMEYAKSLNPKTEIVSSALKCKGVELRQDIRRKLFPLEAGIYELVKSLQRHKKASERLQQWRTLLEDLKRSNDGMVPVVVYKIVELLEMQLRDGFSKLYRDEGVALYQDMGFEAFESMVDSVHEIVLHLRFVLMVSGRDDPLTMSSDVLKTCELVLIRSEEELEMLQGKMGAGKRSCRRKRKAEEQEMGEEVEESGQNYA